MISNAPARDAIERLRRNWLRLRHRYIPHDSPRDRTYRWVRYQLWRGPVFVRESPIRLRQAYAPLRQAYDDWRQYDAAQRRKAARVEYERFQRLVEPSSTDLAQQRADAKHWPQPPVFSIATAVFGPPFRVFRETVKSIRRQTYPHWRWHIVDASPSGRLWPYLKWLAAIDSRIQPVSPPRESRHRGKHQSRASCRDRRFRRHARSR
jgi:hypothetical protein